MNSKKTHLLLRNTDSVMIITVNRDCVEFSYQAKFVKCEALLKREIRFRIVIGIELSFIAVFGSLSARVCLSCNVIGEQVSQDFEREN